MSILSLLNSLQSTSSRLEKESILRSEQDHALFKQVINLALNPFVQFYIRKIPSYVPNTTDHAASLGSILPALSDLSNRVVTGHDARDRLQSILSVVSADDAQVIERIIQKDLKCGVSDGTVNRVWKDFIPSYPVMLCSPYDDKVIKNITFPAIAQLKLDGMRFNAIVDEHGGVTFRSRNGKTLDLCGELEQEFASLGRSMVFDGELLVVDEDGKIMPRQQGNGIMSKSIKGTMTKDLAARVRANLWDVIPLEDFQKGKSPRSYALRFVALNGYDLPEKISVVETTYVDSIDAARDIFQIYLDEGQEGIILKDAGGIWEDKRVKNQIKFKAELECDLRITRWEIGTGKNAGRLGALIAETSDGLLTTGVGTGYSDQDRDNIKEDVVGKIVTVKYNGIIVDTKTGQYSLFLPVFVEIREDKTQADSLEQLKG